MSPCDYRRYPPDWQERRRRILERSGNHCEECGLENHVYGYRDGGQFVILDREPTQEWDVIQLDGYRIIRIVLTIAHLDHDEGNWEVDDDRLRAFCQRCHNRYDREHRNGTARMTRLTGGEAQPELGLIERAEARRESEKVSPFRPKEN